MTTSLMKINGNKNCAIGKAADILKAFIPNNIELGTSEISKRFGFHKATASRILLTLVREEFLSQNADTKKFKLGRKAFIIGRSAIDSLNTALVCLAKKHLDQLAGRLKETVLLEKNIGKKTIVLYVAKEKRAIRLIRSIGERIPIHVSAGGKAILAYSKTERVDNIIGGIAPVAGVEPYVDLEDLTRELKKINAQGFALNNKEGTLGITSIGVPVFNKKGLPVAAVVVTGPGGRLLVETNATIVEKIKKTAEMITDEMANEGILV